MTGFRLPRLNRRQVPLLVVGAAVVFALAYVLLIAQKPPETGGGNWRTTTFGSAVDDPGSFYLLAGYIGYEIQQSLTGQGFAIQSAEVNTWEWLIPLVGSRRDRVGVNSVLNLL